MSRPAILRLISFAAVGLVGSFAACSALKEARSPELKAGACVASALMPLAGTAERAEALAGDLRGGKYDVQAIVDATQATHAEAEALRVALERCAAEYERAKGGAAGAGNDAGASSPDAAE